MASKRSRVPQTRSLKRKVATRQPRKTLVVFCEGEKTEPQYLLALRQEPFVKDAAAVDIQVETGRGGAVPLTLVTLAVAARAKSAAEEAEIDEFWCVFDVEWPRNHPHLSEAIAKARASDIRLAISNPCFELWLILHYRNHGSWLENTEAVRLRRRLDGSTGKSLHAAKYMSLIEDAVRHAALQDTRHQRDGTKFPHNNPSSGMHRLITSVRPPAN
ncbi:MAG: RloB family protein [Trebonia sp.]